MDKSQAKTGEDRVPLWWYISVGIALFFFVVAVHNLVSGTPWLMGGTADERHTNSSASKNLLGR